MTEVDRNVPAELRRERIVALVEQQEFVRVADLSEMFGISEVTIRSDLASLDKVGSVQRVHGGAVAASIEGRLERSFEEEAGASVEEKRSIGVAAAQMVSSGESIILDVGTTTTAVARALVARQDLERVTVFTSAINVALELEPAIPRFTVVVTGGTLRPMQHSLVDPMANYMFERLNASIVFLGCNGIHPESGITNVNLPETAVKQHMIGAAERCVVVADGSKVGKVSTVKIADVDAVDVLVTSSKAPEGAVAEIEAVGPGVIVA